MYDITIGNEHKVLFSKAFLRIKILFRFDKLLRFMGMMYLNDAFQFRQIDRGLFLAI